MDTPQFPERLLMAEATPQSPLPLSTAGVQRYVWESRFGAVLIEVIGDRSYVNGQLVEPAAAPHEDH
jgi:hypothetical protein